MHKNYPGPLLGQVAKKQQIPGSLLVALLLSTAILGGPVSHAQSPGGIATGPSVWYKPDGAAATAWTDASGNNINLSTNGAGVLTVNAGDAAHNFNPWTTGYSSVNYYLYASNTNAVFGAWGDTAGGYRYTALTIFGAARATSVANGAITGLDNDVSYGAEPGFGVQANGSVLNPRSYRYGNNYNAIATSQNIQLRQTSVYLYQPPPGGPSAGTGNLILGLNGTQSITSGVSARSSVAGPHLNIGYDGFTFGAFPGDIQEVIWYKATLGASDISKVETYLAIKYGTTLTHDYVNNSSTIYSLAANSGYTANIAGIVRDDTSALYQKQSNSVNTGKQVLISTTGLANTNATNTGTLTNGQALMWGDNGLAKILSVPVSNIPGTNYRFPSVWKVQNTGSVGTVRVTWPAGLNSLKLVQSSDSTFASGNTTTDMSANTQTINGVTYNYADVTLGDGQYFTFAASVLSPGGITSLPAVWYRPDNASTSRWKDASINTLDLTSENGATVRNGDQAHNFHRWTTAYSATKYYNYLDSTVSNTDLEVNPVFGNYNTNSYSYMPLTVFGVARDTLATGGSGLITGTDNEKANASEPGFGVYGAQQRFYRFSYGAAASGSPAPINMSAIYMWRPTTGGATASGNDTLLMGLNGAYSKSLMNKVGSVVGPYLKIGYSASDWGAFPGDIQEVIWYKDSLGYNDIRKVETYLALKYGTTLMHSYVAASGTTIYDLADSTYRYNIAGIGRETINGGLNQRQSNSVNTGSQVLISTTGLSNANDSNTVQLTDAQYLVWGDNGLAKAPAVYMPGVPNVNIRFTSIWRVQNTGSVGTVRVAWPAGLNNLSLIQSADTIFNASDVVTNMSVNTQTVNGIAYNYADVTLTNGQYFTFASYIAHAPGGVFNGLSQWYRADKQVDTTATGTIANWTDYATSINVTPISTALTPGYRQGDSAYFNFNPGINFSSTNQKLGNISVQTLSSSNFDLFSLTKEGMSGGRFFNIGNDNTTMSGINWDQPGLNADGSVGWRDTAWNTIGNVIASPAFATNTANIMYYRLTDSTGNKGLNGAVLGTTLSHNRMGLPKGGHLFGANSGAGTNGDDGGFVGHIGEMIVYGAGNITSTERNRVDAYLAIKYGITLDTAESYLSSSSSVVWDKSLDQAYYHNVAGIARDVLSDLYQKQSRSQVTNNTNGQITIALGNIYPTNNANTGSLSDGQFMLWGDNGNTQAMTSTASTYTTFAYNGNSNNRRMNRIWKVRNTGVQQTVKLQFPVASIGSTTITGEDACAGYAIIYAPDTTFTTGLIVAPLTTNGTNYEALNNFPQGTSYFTFAKVSSLASGVVVLPGTTTIAPSFTTCATNAWKYAHQVASTNKYLAINGMTDVQLSKLGVTITPNGATYSNAGQSTKVMPRIATVTDTTAGTYTGIKVRVYYDPSELSNTAVINAQTNGWFKYEGDATTLINDINADGVFNTGIATQLTPSASGTEDGIAYVEFSNINHFSSFAYLSSTQSVGTVLPVTLTYFDAYSSGSKVALAWRTAGEQNNKGFGIERSAEGMRWEAINFVGSKAANGNSNEELSYLSYDNNPLTGENYYRLKQTDYDGKYTYSQIRQVRVKKESSIDIYPNPVKNYFTISGLAGDEIISIYDAAGRKVKTIAATDHALTIDCTAMAVGTYHIHIISAKGETVSRKIVKIMGS